MERKLEEARYDFESFNKSFIPWGSGDVARAIEVANDANVDLDDVAEFMEDYGVDLANVDIVAMIYDFALQEARGIIERKADYDLDDAGVYTAGNYLATSYDWSGDLDDLQTAIDEKELKANDFSDTVNWVLDELEITTK